jgi:hypothetical protein
MIEMSKKDRLPAWWRLALLVALIPTLFLIEMRLPVTEGAHRVLQIGIVLLIYGCAWFWLNANEVALIREEQQKRHEALRKVLQPLASQPAIARATDPDEKLRSRLPWRIFYERLASLASSVARLFHL